VRSLFGKAMKRLALLLLCLSSATGIEHKSKRGDLDETVSLEGRPFGAMLWSLREWEV
jgi:hypothetical protein